MLTLLRWLFLKMKMKMSAAPRNGSRVHRRRQATCQCAGPRLAVLIDEIEQVLHNLSSRLPRRKLRRLQRRRRLGSERSGALLLHRETKAAPCFVRGLLGTAKRTCRPTTKIQKTLGNRQATAAPNDVLAATGRGGGEHGEDLALRVSLATQERDLSVESGRFERLRENDFRARKKKEQEGRQIGPACRRLRPI